MSIRNRTWRDDLDDAFDKVELGKTYADDGAYLTAARRLEEAATLFRSAHESRMAAIDAATVKKS